MTTTYNPGVHRFANFVVAWTVLLFIAGALVTSNNAALSVPDWPKSFGTWFPSLRQLAGGAFFEHSHRVIAGGLGIFTVALAILIWLKDERRWLRWFGVIAVAGVAVQAVLGGEVVRQLLQYWLPVIHACFAQIVFAAVLGIAVFTSRWWISERPQLADRGTPSIQTVAMVNACVIFLQVVLGAGFRHSEIPVWPHIVGAFAVMATVTWTAVAFRKRFGASGELSRARALLHAMFGLQFVLGFGAYWARLASEKSGPTSLTVIVTVTHTVVGALLFAFSVLIALICYRLVPRGREVAAATASQVAAQ
jgi:cytochrome c oxidase assembly protein subunit 15